MPRQKQTPTQKELENAARAKRLAGWGGKGGRSQKMDLYAGKGPRTQSSALTAIQEVAEVYLVNLFKAANLCTIHRNRQTITPKDFSSVKAIGHISGIDLWWVLKFCTNLIFRF